MSIINFTVEYDALASLTDSADMGADADVVALVGTVTFTPVFVDKKPVLAPGYEPRPAGLTIRPFIGVVDTDGQLKAAKGGAVGVRLWANDPVLELTDLTYKVDFNLSTTLGEKLEIEGGYFEAPDSDQTINLADVLASTGSPSVSNLNQVEVYAHEIVDSSSIGVDLMTAATPAQARNALQLGDNYQVVNVKHHGAVGNGVADDTAAIEAAWSAAGSRHAIYFPPGNYIYNGSGLDASAIEGIGSVLIVQGAGAQVSTVTLGSSSYLLTPSTQIGTLVLEDIRVEGGKGAIKQTYTGVDTVGTKHVSRVWFNNYTEAAVATDVIDGPFWFIDKCWFNAANSTGTIGVALAMGLTDGCTIKNCNFQTNRIHIKAHYGNDLYISENNFFQTNATTSGGPRVSIWIVPTDGTTNNAGNGLSIQRNKFGAEFLKTGDYWILYADQGSGATNALKMPVLNADSSGVIMGHTISENFFRKGGIFGAGGVAGDDYAPPLIYSTTPKVFDLAVINNQVFDRVDTILQYRTVPTATTYTSSGNYFGPLIGVSDTLNHVGPKVSNDPAVGYTSDPGQVFQTRAAAVRQNSSGSAASYSERLTTAITGFSPISATITGTTDAYGGTDAATITLTDTYGAVTASLSSLVAGLPCWIEFDVAYPASAPCPDIKAYISDNTNLVHWVRRVEVPASTLGWVTYAFSFTPRNTGSSPSLFFIAFGASGDKYKIGRPRVYQSHERIIGGRRSAIAAQATDLTTNRQLVNDLRNKLIAAGIVSGSPYTDPGTAASIDNTVSVTVKDANLTLQDNADTTKQAKFELSGITAGQTRTFTVPDKSTTLVGTDTTDVLTNKTFSTSLLVINSDGTIAGIMQSGWNSASSLANGAFNTGKSVIGSLHLANGSGSDGAAKQAAITFQGSTSAEAQAGIYVSNSSAYGTAMALATTDNYGTGPQAFLTATNAGVVNFPRATPTVASNPISVKVGVPSTADSTGSVGQWATDGSSYLYICTATNTWKRASITFGSW